ncbi:MAG: hypothetical protein DME26_19715 [Verrucomicrobia bacterium]|nr:MAG: hypothetical protein DME26_19715 [Verrucomicrobiota bacterium]
MDLVQVISPQPPPLLRASHTGSTVVISWPASTVGCVLQSENTLYPTHWADVTNTVRVVGSDNTVTDSLSRSNKFFRLRKF